MVDDGGGKLALLPVASFEATERDNQSAATALTLRARIMRWSLVDCGLGKPP